MQSATKTSAGWPRSAVAWPSSSAGGRAGPGGSVGAADGGAVDLLAVEEALARLAGQGGDALAVLVDVGAVVGGQPAEVQRLERPAGHAAAARREERVRARQVGDEMVALPAERSLDLRQHLEADARRRGRRQAAPRAFRRRPSSIAAMARSSASPTAGPLRPAATRSLPSIARRRWRTSSSQRRAPSSSPRAPATAATSGGAPRKRRHSSTSVARPSGSAAAARATTSRSCAGNARRSSVLAASIAVAERRGEGGESAAEVVGGGDDRGVGRERVAEQRSAEIVPLAGPAAPPAAARSAAAAARRPGASR